MASARLEELLHDYATKLLGGAVGVLKEVFFSSRLDQGRSKRWSDMSDLVILGKCTLRLTKSPSFLDSPLTREYIGNMHTP